MSKALLVENEENLRKTRRLLAEVEDLSGLERAIDEQETAVTSAERNARLAVGRNLVGRLVKGDEADAQRRLTAARERLTELRTQLAEARARRDALSEMLPHVQAEAERVVGERLHGEAQAALGELAEAVRVLEAKQRRCDELSDCIESQFTTVTNGGTIASHSYFRGKGPWVGTLRFWGQRGAVGRQPQSVPDRTVWFRSLLKDCGVKTT